MIAKMAQINSATLKIITVYIWQVVMWCLLGHQKSGRGCVDVFRLDLLDEFVISV